jgi:hypothetical protein
MEKGQEIKKKKRQSWENLGIKILSSNTKDQWKV